MQSSFYGVNRINERQGISCLMKAGKSIKVQGQEKERLLLSIQEKLLSIVNDRPKAFSQNHMQKRQMFKTRSKQSISSSSINQKKSKVQGPIRRKTTMIEQLKQKRKKFLDQYGYIKNKYDNRQASSSPQIKVVPNIQYMNEGFLSSFQEMKVQKQMKQYMLKKKTLKMTRQKEGLMKKKIKEKEQEQSKNSSPKSEKFSKTIEDIHGIDRNQIYKNLNIEKLSTSMIKSANRIYGKKYDTDSVAWCANIMNAQYLVEAGDKSENPVEKFQWKDKRKYLPSNQHILNKLMFKFEHDELSSTID